MRWSPPNGLQSAGNDGLRDTAPVSKPLRLGLPGAGVDGFRVPHESKPLGLGFSEARADGLRMPDDSSTSEWRLEADRIKTTLWSRPLPLQTGRSETCSLHPSAFCLNLSDIAESGTDFIPCRIRHDR